MRVLLVGGSGYVGQMTLPYLRQEFDLRVFDLVPPQDAAAEFVQGSVQDAAAIRRALDRTDAVVYMAMGRNPGGSYAAHDIDLNYDLHVKGLHRVLEAAREAGLRRVVYASTTSVHASPYVVDRDSEETPCDARFVYGFTKWLGELVCDYFARVHGMTAVALRLNAPCTQDEWHQRCRPGQPNAGTSAPDVARAIALGVTAPVAGFHALAIAGDYEGKAVNCARAKAVLGWEPLERPRVAAPLAG